MNIKDALIKRKSTRAFLKKAVSIEKIERILNVARYAPSGTNTQPWQVAVVTGHKKRQLEQLLESTFQTGVRGEMDYQYYPSELKEPYKGRRKACAIQLYTTLGITRTNKEKREAQWAANYRAFDAPVMLFFFMDPFLKMGSFLDYGMFIQSVMLAAVEEGLATCAQVALAEYPKIVKKVLDYPDESILVCGMALGYEDTEAKINRYRTPREEVQTFTKFFE
jgi:nitroreductase